jgi:putative MFS transporter
MDLDALIESIPLSLWHVRLLILCGLLFMVDAMEVALLSFLTTCVGNEWHLGGSERASISSVVFCGQLVGGLVWGNLADKYGRKQTFLAASALIAVFGRSLCSPSMRFLST